MNGINIYWKLNLHNLHNEIIDSWDLKKKRTGTNGVVFFFYKQFVSHNTWNNMWRTTNIMQPDQHAFLQQIIYDTNHQFK